MLNGCIDIILRRYHTIGINDFDGSPHSLFCYFLLFSVFLPSKDSSFQTVFINIAAGAKCYVAAVKSLKNIAVIPTNSE